MIIFMRYTMRLPPKDADVVPRRRRRPILILLRICDDSIVITNDSAEFFWGCYLLGIQWWRYGIGAVPSVKEIGEDHGWV